MRTVKQWLEEKDLPTELGRVFVPKEEWEHDWFDNLHVPRCAKCQCDSGSVKSQKPCPVPNRIKINWNTAMEAYRDVGPQRADTYLHQVWEMLIESPVDVNYMSYEMWKDEESQPKHYLIAAAMAAEGKKNETMQRL